MRIDIATLFTQMCGSVLNESIVGRGIRNGFIEVHTHDIRKYTENKHRRVDDKPYGGGTGMLMQAQPVYDCISRKPIEADAGELEENRRSRSAKLRVLEKL